MTEEPRSAQIAHVLFLDIVGYSRETTGMQSQMLNRLNATVTASKAFSDALAVKTVQPIPTGDGMALLFYSNVMAPAQCAIDVARGLRDGTPKLPVRMGLHSGLVQRQMDINGKENVVGEGINTAQRVMDVGDAGHILMSVQYANWLQQFEDWAPSIQPLGESAAKHGQIVHLYSLRGKDFGLEATPTRMTGANLTTTSAAAPAASDCTAGPSGKTQKIALLYKPNQQPDEDVLRILETRLRESGHDVFIDNQTKISANWAKTIDNRIRAADAVIAIVSPKSRQSEMLEYEIETAHDQFSRTAKPIILPVRIGQGDVPDGVIASMIRPYAQFVWTGEEDTPKLLAELQSAITEPLKLRQEDVKLEPVGGAVPPDSPFYVARSSDQEFLQALQHQESILLVKGARQMGKTSLLAQGTKKTKDLGWRVGLTDFQKLNAAQMAEEETFYRLLAATLARQLKFKYDFETEWDEIFGANLNMENFLRELLDSAEEPLVWYMDEVDKLFLAPFAGDFFGLVRSWHNSRSTEPDGPWNKLTVIIAYATEAHLFIQDLNQSPFNVGRRLDLEDFNLQQIVDLNGRYGSPLKSYQDVETLHGLIGGQPFLTRRALDTLATGKMDLDTLNAQAIRDDGPFSDHLKRLLVAVTRLPAVVEYARALLSGSPKTDQDSYYRLLSAGIIKQTPEGKVIFRCALYQRYLEQHTL